MSKKSKDEKKPSRKAVNKLSELGTEMAEIWNGYNDTTNSDVLGSYTGNPADSDKRPEQDLTSESGISTLSTFAGARAAATNCLGSSL